MADLPCPRLWLPSEISQAPSGAIEGYTGPWYCVRERGTWCPIAIWTPSQLANNMELFGYTHAFGPYYLVAPPEIKETEGKL